jgi:hypothetical protein
MAEKRFGDGAVAGAVFSSSAIQLPISTPVLKNWVLASCAAEYDLGTFPSTIVTRGRNGHNSSHKSMLFI